MAKSGTIYAFDGEVAAGEWTTAVGNTISKCERTPLANFPGSPGSYGWRCVTTAAGGQAYVVKEDILRGSGVEYGESFYVGLRFRINTLPATSYTRFIKISRYFPITANICNLHVNSAAAGGGAYLRAYGVGANFVDSAHFALSAGMWHWAVIQVQRRSEALPQSEDPDFSFGGARMWLDGSLVASVPLSSAQGDNGEAITGGLQLQLGSPDLARDTWSVDWDDSEIAWSFPVENNPVKYPDNPIRLAAIR